MKWELETSKTGILVLKFNVSETNASHMQLQKHLASYFLGPELLEKGRKNALAKWFPFSSYRACGAAFLECSAYILRFTNLFSSRCPNLSNQDTRSERCAPTPPWVTAAPSPAPPTLIMWLILLSSKNINLDKLLTLISCYVYWPRKHLPNTDSVRRVVLSTLFLTNS